MENKNINLNEKTILNELKGLKVDAGVSIDLKYISNKTGLSLSDIEITLTGLTKKGCIITQIIEPQPEGTIYVTLRQKGKDVALKQFS